jgi:hypothetical protein
MDITEFISIVKDIHTRNLGQEFIYTLEEYKYVLCNYDKDKFLTETGNIYDVGLKYLLHAIIEEANCSHSCFELYELSSENSCDIALFKLGKMYEDGGMKEIDICKSIRYYYAYYKRINDLETFMESINIMRDAELCEIFMDSYCGIDKVQKQIDEQTMLISKLRKRIIELEYMPNGVGYNECKKHFESLVNSK